MELCARHKYKIEWGNIDEITLLNNTKNFTANLIVHGKNYTGEGKKKQLAKQNAAENALEDLEKNPLSVNSSTMVSSPASASSSTLNETNPVSKLMELCAQNRLSAPEFTLIYESKPPQTPFFTIACSIKAMNILTQGSESSKKAAKKKAAEEALKEIESKGFLKELESRKGRSLKNDTVDGDIESSPTMAHIKTKFLEECEGLALDPTCFDCLRDKDSAFDYDMYLQDLAKKVNCKVEYLDFSETKFLRVNRCVCQLISEEYQVPVLTAMAKSEVNYEEAKILASKRALLMLLISTYQFT
ncbi:interferon-inducible double-stranded RNA-dependent protein kinase activator A-like isoform X2 [Dinothrombium tinctorium]|uniref:Interferon-inducible double-stranded RNA-dependent protein kinase activator A-like isoform X2 n=1 Tax=Dinothrombium tinctorium TaxID=1965070 RepID=A0A3S3PPR7_9ACAR|nr:interferon-inducible double-stranded RNA-dependent protein kinase activator A-like isoform X2 [Dinothrombium tinctorium]